MNDFPHQLAGPSSLPDLAPRSPRLRASSVSDRRELLVRTGALAATALLPRTALATRSEGSPLLVAVYLRGGADFLNIVAPIEDEIYRSVRPTIGLDADAGAVPLVDGFALHPGLRPLEPVWRSGELAPIVCTGSPDGTRSHFDAQDFMERAAPSMRNITTGWLNRFLTSTQGKNTSEFRAVAPQTLLPRSLRGEAPALAVAPGQWRSTSDATLGEFEELYQQGGGMERRADEPDVVDTGHATIETLRRFNEILQDVGELDDARFPDTAFGNRMRSIAALARADCGLEVAAVDYPGWDHHINQGGADGLQAAMLADYAESLAAFWRSLGPRTAKTLVLTMTEFGRTVRENGNGGSDHGRGSGMLLMGGGVRGGKVHGKWRGLEDKELIDGRDLPITTDFRDVFATALEALFGFSAPKDFFPAYKPHSLPLF